MNLGLTWSVGNRQMAPLALHFVMDLRFSCQGLENLLPPRACPLPVAHWVSLRQVLVSLAREFLAPIEQEQDSGSQSVLGQSSVQQGPGPVGRQSPSVAPVEAHRPLLAPFEVPCPLTAHIEVLCQLNMPVEVLCPLTAPIEGHRPLAAPNEVHRQLAAPVEVQL